jgi:hypothetical protein
MGTSHLQASLTDLESYPRRQAREFADFELLKFDESF